MAEIHKARKVWEECGAALLSTGTPFFPNPHVFAHPECSTPGPPESLRRPHYTALTESISGHCSLAEPPASLPPSEVRGLGGLKVLTFNHMIGSFANHFHPQVGIGSHLINIIKDTFATLRAYDIPRILGAVHQEL